MVAQAKAWIAAAEAKARAKTAAQKKASAQKAAAEKSAADVKVGILENIRHCLFVYAVLHREFKGDIMKTQRWVETDLLGFATTKPPSKSVHPAYRIRRASVSQELAEKSVHPVHRIGQPPNSESDSKTKSNEPKLY